MGELRWASTAGARQLTIGYREGLVRTRCHSPLSSFSTRRTCSSGSPAREEEGQRARRQLEAGMSALLVLVDMLYRVHEAENSGLAALEVVGRRGGVCA